MAFNNNPKQKQIITTSTSNNDDAKTSGTRNPSATTNTFEYSFPNDEDDYEDKKPNIDNSCSTDDDTESNKSTPYYTPLEFFNNSFEFPSPKPPLNDGNSSEKANFNSPSSSSFQTKYFDSSAQRVYVRQQQQLGTVQTTTTTTTTLNSTPQSPPLSSLSSSSSISQQNNSKHLLQHQVYSLPTTIASSSQQITSSCLTSSSSSTLTTSPNLNNRKLRRFSFSERRSLSPQHILVKGNIVSGVCLNQTSSVTTVDTGVDPMTPPVEDKENAKPINEKIEDNLQHHLITHGSGNNSPIALLFDDSSSPKVLATAGDTNAKISYSPKFLASINNMKLVSGSPLGVISSAGYKNGNYFKFPEIDQIVQTQSQAGTLIENALTLEDNQLRCGQKLAYTRLGGNVTPAMIGMTTQHPQQHQYQLQHQHQPSTPQPRTPPTSSVFSSCSNSKVTLEPELACDKQEFGSNNETLEFLSKNSAIISSDSLHHSNCKNYNYNNNNNSANHDCVRKNRKNKNNLTIKISDASASLPLKGNSTTTPGNDGNGSSGIKSPSPSPKPKTPTIKTTKEKALSLDSAACESALSIVIQSSSGSQKHISCDEIDAESSPFASGVGRGLNLPGRSSKSGVITPGQLIHRSANNSRERLRANIGCDVNTTSGASNRSTSLSQPSLYARTPSVRGRVSQQPNTGDLLQYQRSKQNQLLLSQSLSSDTTRSSVSDSDCFENSTLREGDETHLQVVKHSLSSGTATSPAAVYRSGHKPFLHASNTNLKTLPECLTLAEFSTSSPREHDQYPYKQKSMDLPSSTLQMPSSVVSTQQPQQQNQHTPVIRTSGSTSLLQRRGSNHSLTLNLHGSCSNLLGSCRSGLSISNYSLGSAANSTTNLNPKSSNLDIMGPGSSNAQQQKQTVHTIQPGLQSSASLMAPGSNAGLQPTTQGAKQSLFRRRGSNHSLTLTNLTATSCVNLNSFASQNSLNVDRGHLQMTCSSGGTIGIGGGVTRTTSFITPTHTTTSHATPTKRGLLERRGSNQSLTLNMSSSFGGIGSSDRSGLVGGSNLYIGSGIVDDNTQIEQNTLETTTHAPYCAAAQINQNQRKFFSSESLYKANTSFSDLNHAHRRNANQICFGSVSDLKRSSGESSLLSSHVGSVDAAAGGVNTFQREHHFDFQESKLCTCSGVRNIMTRPLSPQATTEEFKTYLANIQMLQNASNHLNQMDLIKLNYVFDNSYASNSRASIDQSLPIVLNVHHNNNNSSNITSNTNNNNGSNNSNNSNNNITNKQSKQDTDSVPTAAACASGNSGLLTTSEDCEIAARYEEAVHCVLEGLQLDVDEQKRIFRELYKEFWDLPLNHQEKPMVLGTQNKNRYRTILPNEHTRVILEKEILPLRLNEASEITEVYEEAPYINANYIKGPDFLSKCYVATQGPLPNTIFEFWLMVFQNVQKHHSECSEASRSKEIKTLPQYYQKIIMLTNFLENDRPKCAVYFPTEINEICITSRKHEVLPTNQYLNEFFEKYLDNKFASDSTTTANDVVTVKCGNNFILEQFQIAYEDEFTQHLSPSSGNCFVIKNIGIVRKNGFSIRKFIVLYCIMSQKQKPKQKHHREHKNATSDAGLEAATTTVIESTSESDNTNKMLMYRFECFHYWYPDWPDHRSPRDINTLVDICLHILNLGKCEAEFEAYKSFDSEHETSIDDEQLELDKGKSNVGPKYCDLKSHHVEFYQRDIFNTVQPLPVIHCSAGIGRTGCLTAILNGIRQLRQSLASSLTSMAANLSRELSGTPEKVLSPIDFCLPSSFLEKVSKEYHMENVYNDTDSSFTFNTLLYLRYIIEKSREKLNSLQQSPTHNQCTEEKGVIDGSNSSTVEVTSTTCEYKSDVNLERSLALSTFHSQQQSSSQQLPSLAELTKLPDISVDILGIVCNLRLQRGGMVQNSEQYELIHRAICLYLKRTFALKRF